MMIKFLKSILMGPDRPKDHLIARFYLRGGQTVTTYGVKSVETSKTNEGGFASYKIEWHPGFKPEMFSLTLDHISAIEVLKG
jgi:hypothetical protein